MWLAKRLISPHHHHTTPMMMFMQHVLLRNVIITITEMAVAAGTHCAKSSWKNPFLEGTRAKMQFVSALSSIVENEDLSRINWTLFSSLWSWSSSWVPTTVTYTVGPKTTSWSNFESLKEKDLSLFTMNNEANKTHVHWYLWHWISSMEQPDQCV